MLMMLLQQANPAAAADIYLAKGRPSDNPLIVHIADISQLEKLASGQMEVALALAEAFWPGPLTMILPKQKCVPDVTTGGLNTVAVRMPQDAAALELIRRAGVPVAAPSANLSGRPSPTAGAHVIQDLFGRVDVILTGNDCRIGIESTILDLTGEKAVVLRPGLLTPEELGTVLGYIPEIDPGILKKPGSEEGQNPAPRAPGMKYKHYAPTAQVTIIKSSFEQFKKFLYAQKDTVCAVCFEGEGKYFEKYIEYGKENDGLSQAHRIFDALREVDAMGCARAFVRCPISSGVGLAVYNRLLRSAAFRVIDLDINIPVIGLTGQTGAGKTTVASMLKNTGYAIVDADVLARKAVENAEVINLLKKNFGEDIVNDGILNRSELAKRAFSSEEGSRTLNIITHPEITRLAVEEIHKAEKDGAKAAVIDAALLFDSCLTYFCQKTISVIADEETRLRRIMKRDSIDRESAMLRINAQPKAEYYIKNADIVIDNNGDIDGIEAQIGDLL